MGVFLLFFCYDACMINENTSQIFKFAFFEKYNGNYSASAPYYFKSKL